MNDLVLAADQFVIISDNTLKTTSLKIAEAFEKRHDHVIRDIRKIIEVTKDILTAPKFGECQRINELANNKPEPYYEMDKDGFMLVVMGYTGEKAMAIKIAYINAFNTMHDKLFPKIQPLPRPPLKKTKVAVEGGLSLETQDELKKMVDDLAATLPKDQQVSAVIGMWSALGGHFEAKKLKGNSKLAAYKFIPEAARLECISLLARLPLNDMVTLSNADMTALIDTRVQEHIKALPAPEPLEGEVLPKPQANSITYHLAPLENNAPRRLLLVQTSDLGVSLMPLDADKEVMSREQFIRELQQDNHLVAERTAHGVRDMVMKFMPIQLMPVILEAATTRMQRCNWQMPA